MNSRKSFPKNECQKQGFSVEKKKSYFLGPLSRMDPKKDQNGKPRNNPHMLNRP